MSDPQRNPDKDIEPHTVRKSRMKFIVIPLLLIVAAVAAFIMWPGSVSRQEAQEIAVAHVGGGATNRAEWDFESFQRVWSVEVFHDGLVHEVFVNRSNGQVVRVEIDRWD